MSEEDVAGLLVEPHPLLFNEKGWVSDSFILMLHFHLWKRLGGNCVPDIKLVVLDGDKKKRMLDVPCLVITVDIDIPGGVLAIQSHVQSFLRSVHSPSERELFGVGGDRDPGS